MRTVGGSRGSVQSERSKWSSWLSVARAVLPWGIAASGALLLTCELSPPRAPIVKPPTGESREPSARPPDQKQNDRRPDREEIVYEPWEAVCT
jgi:hypothetical protein